MRTIDPTHVRRLIVSKQHLDGAARPPMLDVIRDLGCVQLDPIRRVERTHLLVLWSRLGVFDPAQLERLRWEERSLFEYWAHAASLVLTEDYPIHATHMRRVRRSDQSRAWLDEHELAPLRDHVLQRIQAEGPLRPGDIGHDGQTAEHFTGWTSNRAINRLFGYLWNTGELLVCERKGNQRRWNLAERVLPEWTPRDELDEFDASYRAVQRAVRALGVARGKKHINWHFTRHRYWHFEDVLQKLLDEDALLPVQIGDWAGEWLMHRDDLPLLERIEAGDWQPKTTLLSPFDNLICDRDRTEQIWDFNFRIEIYVPKEKREYGYYVLPILHGETLIGRMDMEYNRKTKTLHIHATYAEAHAPAAALEPLREAVHSLARFVGAETIAYGDTLPDIWLGLGDG